MASQAQHGVSFAHAEQAFRDEFAVTIQDLDARARCKTQIIMMSNVF
jgi:uncharacterized DUF497 family protein